MNTEALAKYVPQFCHTEYRIVSCLGGVTVTSLPGPPIGMPPLPAVGPVGLMAFPKDHSPRSGEAGLGSAHAIDAAPGAGETARP